MIAKEVTFGQKLKRLRVGLGLSQTYVSEAMDDMSQSKLSALEHRELAPRQTVLNELNEFYQVDNSYWFDDALCLAKHESEIIYLLRAGEYSKCIEFISALEQLDKLSIEAEAIILHDGKGE